MTVHVEVNRIGLALCFEEDAWLLGEGDADLVGTSFDGHADGEEFVYRLMIATGGRRLDSEDAEAFSVEDDLDFVGAAEAFDMFVAVAGEADLELVFSVNGEGVREEGATASAERELVQVLFLREVGAKSDGVATGRFGSDADGETADLTGCGEVAFEERGGKIADGKIVETVTGFVGGQE